MTAATATELDDSIQDYLDMVEKTAIYPEVGQGTLRSLAYATSGLSSEAGETLEKVVDPMEGASAVQAELGDVAWYVFSNYREVGGDASSVFRSAILGIREVDSPGNVGLLAAVDSVAWVVASAAKVAGLFKKAIRDDDGVFTTARKERMLDELENLVAQWVFVHLALGLDCEETLRGNADKLLERKERGVIAGDGDNR